MEIGETEISDVPWELKKIWEYKKLNDPSETWKNFNQKFGIFIMKISKCTKDNWISRIFMSAHIFPCSSRQFRIWKFKFRLTRIMTKRKMEIRVERVVRSRKTFDICCLNDMKYQKQNNLNPLWNFQIKIE